MHVLFLLSVLLLYDAHGYTVSLNSNRKFLFGDVLEPLVSVDLQGESLKNGELVELFHTWELFTASQISSGSIADYRKAMPCFPGPNLNTTVFNNDTIPPYPDCDTFVNISKTTIEEMEDLMDGIQKDRGGTQNVDVSLKTVMNSLVNRMQNLIDYLPEGQTKQKVQTQLFNLVAMSTRTPSFETYPNSSTTPNPFFYSNPPTYSNPPAHQTKFNPSDLLNCFNISSVSSTDLLALATQTIGSVACSRFQICSFSDLAQNPCLGPLNITEKQYESVVQKTIGGILKDRILGSMDHGGGRFRRTVEPEDVTPVMKMDGREDSGGVLDMNYGEIDSEDVLKRRMEEEESSGAGSMEEGILKDPKIQMKTPMDSESSGAFLEDQKILESSGAGSMDPEDPKIQKRIQKILESSGDGSGAGSMNSSPAAPKKPTKKRKDVPDCCDYTLETSDFSTTNPAPTIPQMLFDFTKDPVQVIGIERPGASESERQAAREYIAKMQEQLDKKSMEGSGSGSMDPGSGSMDPGSGSMDPSEDLVDLLESSSMDPEVRPGCCDYTTEGVVLSSGAGSMDPEAPRTEDPGSPKPSGAEAKDPELESSGSMNPENPENPGFTNPGSTNPGSTNPENPESTNPENPGSTNPKNPGFTTPENPGSTNPGSTNPEASGSTNPENPGSTTPENPGSTNPENPGSINPDPELLSQNHFSEALGYFGGSSLLHYPLNSSMVEYAISFLNSTDPLKRKLEQILPELGAEFTLMDLLKQLNISELDPSILESLGSIFGVGASEISGILKELTGGGADLSSVWKKNSPESSSGSSPSPPSATIQTAILNAIKPNDTASLVSNAMNFLKENPNILEKFKSF
ncbi:unnamed protein product [Caenorhabditis brenneri]